MVGKLHKYASKAEIEFLVKGHSYQETSAILRERFPGIKGFSERSLKRYSKDKEITKNNTSKDDQMVKVAINEVYSYSFFEDFLLCLSSFSLSNFSKLVFFPNYVGWGKLWTKTDDRPSKSKRNKNF